MLNRHVFKNKKVLFFGIFTFIPLTLLILVRSAEIFILYYVFKNLIDEGLTITSWSDQLILSVSLYVAFAVLDPLLVMVFNYSFRMVLNHVSFDFKNKVYQKYYKTNVEFLKQKNSGEILNIINVDFMQLQSSWFNYVFSFFPIILGTISAIVFVGIINWIVLLIFLGFSALLLIIEYISVKMVNKTKIVKSQASQEFNVKMLQKFSIFQLYLNSNYKLPFLNFLKMITGTKTKIHKRQEDKVVLIELPALILRTFSVLILFGFIWLLFKDNLMIGIPIMVLTITRFSHFYSFVSASLSVFGDRDNYKKFSKKVNDYFEAYDKQVANVWDQEITSIKLENASFSINNKNIIKNLNLEIKTYDKILISGPSGSGKSMILSLILNEQKLTSGQLLYNEQKLAENTEVYSQMTYASEHNYIIDGNLDENITFNLGNTNHELLASLKKDLAINYVQDLKVNLNKLNLSEGQKQKIVIARSFYQNKKFLIFDEVIANLDKDAKALVENILLKYNGTLLFISHLPLKKEKTIFNKFLIYDKKTHSWNLTIN